MGIGGTRVGGSMSRRHRQARKMLKDNQESTEYIPFGKEWEKEMMKFNKQQLIDLLRKALKKILEAEG